MMVNPVHIRRYDNRSQRFIQCYWDVDVSVVELTQYYAQALVKKDQLSVETLKKLISKTEE